MIRPLAVAMGDPAGVGPEIIAKAWNARQLHSLAPFFAVGDIRSVQRVWDGPVIRIDDPADAAGHFADALPVLSICDAGEVTPGQPSVAGARCALQTLEIACGLARSGAAGALVTGPVSKAQLYDVGFVHPGQTEFVAENCGVSTENAVMMLAGPTLRVVPMTVHVAFAKVPELISIDLVLTKARVTARGLYRNFGIERPRLAFAGLNPHSGEGGAIGREEIEILQPAIAQLRDEGIDAVGPFAADGMFHARARAGYDAALCLYHDQALVPIKTLHFDEGVNITLGLPIVRTSPDHGTAFNIAGTDQAEPGAMIAAIRMAASAAQHRTDVNTTAGAA
ncbi:4-hydroxythreonine-4-phosphate dehydrogenase PdxA [Stakelama tenebrarum]|uniref:4-hydroxythreonine-4-phosphate dehydrogenase n=1 Tax=Stakelama tenebrarum TaxID=2711215 RepID=A0A6G6Y7K7_9SPHN|nr:4-hydroxythreonine-4-phosphate dehydrogenase PdxA [Sphingosinithalassobacter tenebrarum]QIG80556.1 4-hydroxythreonine-4-phosphate dehydrogenase PdxA [Sphingosinithalassobacter tenebrarum]